MATTTRKSRAAKPAAGLADLASPAGIAPDPRTASAPAPPVKGDKPILDFDEIAPARDWIRKDGKAYELRRTDDFGIAKQQELQRDGREFSRLWDSEEELDEHQQLRLKTLLERMFDDVLAAPRTVKAKFSDAQKSQVVLTFTLAPLKKLMEAAAGQQENSEDQEAGVSVPTSAS